ncbi:hypothetical protein Tco_1491708 [Tanacetum coccineum]
MRRGSFVLGIYMVWCLGFGVLAGVFIGVGRGGFLPCGVGVFEVGLHVLFGRVEWVRWGWGVGGLAEEFGAVIWGKWSAGIWGAGLAALDFGLGGGLVQVGAKGELLPEEIKRIQQILERTSFDAITPDFSITDSLSMGDEHLSTIPETESDKLIKSSVENLVPTPSESEDLSNIESKCDVPVCDDFTTISNPLFDADNDFSSSDDKSFSDEDVPKEIYLNPLFDEEIISTKIDPHHFNVDLITHIDLIPPEINEGDFDPEEDIRLVERLLYDNSSPRPPEEFNSKNSDAIIEPFSPSHIPVEDSDSLMAEIDLFLTPDDSMPPGIENDDYESEGDILFLEELLSNDSPSLHENKSFHFDVPSSPRPHVKPPDDGNFEPDTGVFTKKKVVDGPFILIRHQWNL